MAFRGVRRGGVLHTGSRCVSLRCVPSETQVPSRRLYDREGAGPRLDYRKSHRDRWVKSCSVDDLAALHRAAFSRHGNAHHKDDDGERGVRESLFVGGL